MSTEIWGAITEDQYNIWRHHPVSRAMFKYYGDYADTLTKELLARWQSGILISQDEQEMRGRVNTLQEIVDQPYQAVRTFYETPVIEESEQSDAA